MTVIVLNSGTTFNIPADWSNTNQIETWGAGGGSGGGGAGSLGGNGGGGGAYSSSSNTAGLSGTVNIGVGASATNVLGSAGTNGGDTWFNGTALGSATVSSQGGKGGGTGGTGGAGGSASLGNGTTKTSGGTGGGNASSQTGGGGGGGSPGPAGAGGAGQGGVSGGGGGHGGTGNAGGGTAGSGGSSGTPAGGNGGSSQSGGGGGGGGFGGNTAGATGGNGGLPGGGGGGNGDGESTTFNSSGGGQIRLTYTPAATGITPYWTDNPVQQRYRQAVGAKDSDKWEYAGWQQSPLGADTPDTRGMVYDLPPVGRFNWTRYQDRQLASVRDNQPIAVGSWVYDVPPGRFNPARYQDWQRGVIPAEFLVPLPQTEVPKGRYNVARYQDIQAAPLSGDVVTPPLLPQTDLPQRTWDRRNLYYYQGVQLAPQPTIMSPPSPVYDVPPGKWNVARYQDWQHTFQPLEFQAPLPQVDVPRGVVKHSYAGWQNYQAPSDVQPPLQSSYSTDLPPVGRQQPKRMDLYQGSAVAPSPGNVVPTIPAMWLPLIGVGNQGP